MTLRHLVRLAVLMAVWLVPAPLWAGVTLHVAPEVVVHGDELRVADLGTIEGDETLAAQVGAVRLGAAPAPGSGYRLDPTYLRLRLRQQRIDPATVELVAPGHILVTRAAQVLPGQALVEAATGPGLARLEALDPRGGPYALVPVSRPGELRLPTGKVELSVRLQEPSPPYRFLSATLTVRVDGRDVQTVPVTFQVARLQSVVVANHALEPQAVPSLADFRLESRPSTEVPPGALAAITDASGMEVVRPIKAGEVITERLLRPRMLVRRGETVTLVVEGRGFRITTVGQAGEDARRGDPVRVLNSTSKREVLGRAEAPGLVRVTY